MITLEAADFWDMTPAQRQPVLLNAIARVHDWHYPRNPAYQRLERVLQDVASQVVGLSPQVEPRAAADATAHSLQP